MNTNPHKGITMLETKSPLDQIVEQLAEMWETTIHHFINQPYLRERAAKIFATATQRREVTNEEIKAEITSERCKDLMFNERVIHTVRWAIEQGCPALPRMTLQEVREIAELKTLTELNLTARENELCALLRRLNSTGPGNFTVEIISNSLGVSFFIERLKVGDELMGIQDGDSMVAYASELYLNSTEAIAALKKLVAEQEESEFPQWFEWHKPVVLADLHASYVRFDSIAAPGVCFHSDGTPGGDEGVSWYFSEAIDQWKHIPSEPDVVRIVREKDAIKKFCHSKEPTPEEVIAAARKSRHEEFNSICTGKIVDDVIDLAERLVKENAEQTERAERAEDEAATLAGSVQESNQDPELREAEKFRRIT